MKSIYVVIATLALVTIVEVAISTQQVSAFGFVERQEFKKLTKDLKAIIDIGATQPPKPDKIEKLLDDYSDDVMALFQSASNITTP